MRDKDKNLLFHGKRIDVLSIETELENGKIVKQELVSHPGAVAVLPFLDDDMIILIRNHRYAIQKTLWELPAGTLEQGENPKSCAFRELLEETGYSANKMQKLLEFYTTPGFCNEKIQLFCARELTFSKQNLDETENIEMHAVALKSAYKMIESGEICDAKTICGLLYYKAQFDFYSQIS